MAGGFWDDERTERLKKLVAEGHSFSAIAVVMGAPSRSTVIGKAFRLKLCSPKGGTRHSATLRHAVRKASRKTGVHQSNVGAVRIVENGKTKSRRILDALASGGDLTTVAAKFEVSVATVRTVKSNSLDGAEQYAPSIDIARKPLLALLEGDCRWPVGTPGKKGFGFCAAPRRPGKPYCDGHLRRAERPIEQQPREIRRSFANDNATAPVRETEKV